MKNMSTENYYYELKDLTIEELNKIQHQCSDKISHLYHDMGTAIAQNDKEKYKNLNNESINIHNKLSAAIILINHKEQGLI